MAFEQHRHAHAQFAVAAGRRGFSLTELLVAATIILILTSLLATAVLAAQSRQKKYQTEALLEKLDGIVSSHYSSYASRNVDLDSNQSRGEALRAMVTGDLPDTWERVESMATGTSLDTLSPHQQAYRAVWNSISNPQEVKRTNGSAECLFMIVMQGGIADCLDCRMSKIDVGDQDGDNMPEFLDAWGMPIGFVLWPSGLRLPAGSSTPFFAAALPFDSAVPSLGDAKGGLLRPLLFSMGPDRIAGIAADASPLPGATEAGDNITNFEQEVTR
jgi:prepilin-type N-terminal cleavage/methylation domain-containing protein